MKFTSLLTSSALLIAGALNPLFAADAGLTSSQKTEVQKIVHDYLIHNPEVLLEASQALQQKQQQTMQKQAQENILKNAAQLFTENMAVAGNPKGNVTIVEFFDYQCIHCKKMSPIISGLLKSDPNLRVVFKEFPIFGKSSDLASKAALAAALQGKYLPMHEALISQEQRLNAEIIDNIAKNIGLDMNKFKSDMDSKPVAEALKANRDLAEQLHLMGTPAFIVASTPNGQFNAKITPVMIPGAASEETLKGLIKKAQ